MAIAYRRIASDIAQDVSIACGIPPNVNPFSSANPDQKLIVWAMNRAGLELVRLPSWQELTKNATISVVQDSPGQAEKGYSLPSDFLSFHDQTQWDTGNLTPAVGPLSTGDVQISKQWQITSALGLAFYVRGDMIYFVEPPAVARDFNFYYNSVNWVQDGDEPTTYKSSLSKNTDKPLFDANMFEILSAIKWLNRKGLDSKDLQATYTVLRNGQREGGAQVINMAGNSPYGQGIGMMTIPQTGYGS